jgi:hypothetical protein
MGMAAYVPRVYGLVVCDEALASEIEADVYTLENVRYGFVAESYPHRRSLCVYLYLSHHRQESFRGVVRIRRRGDDLVVADADFVASFDGVFPLQVLYLEMEGYDFPAAGWYDCQVMFGPSGQAVIRAEQPFAALPGEDEE